MKEYDRDHNKCYISVYQVNEGRKTDLRRTLKHGKDAYVGHTHKLIRTKPRHKPVSSSLEISLSWPKLVGTNFKMKFHLFKKKKEIDSQTQKTNLQLLKG